MTLLLMKEILGLTVDGDITFRDRVFPKKIGEYVKNIDLLSLIEDEVRFTSLSDSDSIRLSLARTRRAKDREPFIQSSLKDRVKALEGLCDSLMILPKEIKSLKARVYKLETIINHVVTKKKGLNQKHKDSTSGKQCDLGDKYWSDQDGEPFFKYIGSTNPSANKDAVNDLVDALDDLVDENDVVEAAEQKETKYAIDVERANSRKRYRFVESPLHMKVAIERCGTNKRRYVNVLRPPIEEDITKKVLSMDRLKKQNNVLDEFMIEMCQYLKPWKEACLL
ncbi:hypothetical protein Tco_0032074 [Tanacetum coccineum]